MAVHRSFRTAPAALAAWCRRWAIIAGMACWCGSTAAAAESTAAKEYLVKAAFLYNFTKFVEWPPDHFANDTTPIRIGVFGRNPFGDGLAATVRDRMVNGRAIEVVELRRDEPPQGVDLLFVCAAEEKRFSALPAHAPPAGVLTVGESREFAAAGGMITFITEGEKIRFAINVEAAERGGIKLSSKLLSIASTVQRGGPSP